jgi:hypothetical protein
VKVSIVAPADAKVEVDGRLVDVKQGTIDVEGLVGSNHPLRVSAAGRDTREEIKITETGPMPARVELVVPRVAAGGNRNAAPPAHGGVAPAQPSSKPTAQTAPTAPSGAPTIVKSW